MVPATNVLDGRSVTLETRRVQVVVTVLELDDTTDTVAHTEIVLSGKVLERLHETTSHVTSLGSLDCSVDQTFTTRDSVEQELGGSKTGEETVTDETLRRRVLRLLAEVRQGTVLETVGDTVTGNNLLSDKGNHLRDVDTRTCLVSSSQGEIAYL